MSNWNGKIRCIKNCGNFTVGDIYEIKNGQFCNIGNDSYKYENITVLNLIYRSQFEEVKIPKLCEILGVEPNEEFEIRYKSGEVFDDENFHITYDGHLSRYNKTYEEYNITDRYIANLINGEYEIVKLPQFSEAEITIMSTLYLNDYYYIARDKCGDLWAYEDEPEECELNEYLSNKGHPYNLNANFFKQVQWGNVLDIKSELDKIN